MMRGKTAKFTEERKASNSLNPLKKGSGKDRKPRTVSQASLSNLKRWPNGVSDRNTANGSGMTGLHTPPLHVAHGFLLAILWYLLGELP
jgi:hypothetical protein